MLRQFAPYLCRTIYLNLQSPRRLVTATPTLPFTTFKYLGCYSHGSLQFSGSVSSCLILFVNIFVFGRIPYEHSREFGFVFGCEYYFVTFTLIINLAAPQAAWRIIDGFFGRWCRQWF